MGTIVYSKALRAVVSIISNAHKQRPYIIETMHSYALPM